MMNEWRTRLGGYKESKYETGCFAYCEQDVLDAVRIALRYQCICKEETLGNE